MMITGAGDGRKAATGGTETRMETIVIGMDVAGAPCATMTTTTSARDVVPAFSSAAAIRSFASPAAMRNPPKRVSTRP
jgi:hypothetical protein